VKLTGGVTFTILMFLISGLWGACYVGSALWMAYWTKSVSDDIAQDKETNNYYYLIIYVILSISSGVLVFLRSWAFVIVSSNSANRMHNKMVSCLMYAP
jgi:ABC-type bacteriocin/lantibiotic exporter with double-glycine peptidase domain